MYALQGILNVYRYSLGQIELYGPTNFSSILDMSIQYASSGTSQESQQYYLLLIITVSHLEKDSSKEGRGFAVALFCCAYHQHVMTLKGKWHMR